MLEVIVTAKTNGRYNARVQLGPGVELLDAGGYPRKWIDERGNHYHDFDGKTFEDAARAGSECVGRIVQRETLRRLRNGFEHVVPVVEVEI